jgi:hypothetical protein
MTSWCKIKNISGQLLNPSSFYPVHNKATSTVHNGKSGSEQILRASIMGQDRNTANFMVHLVTKLITIFAGKVKTLSRILIPKRLIHEYFVGNLLMERKFWSPDIVK